MTWDHPRAYACLEAASAEFGKTHGVEIGWTRRSLQEFADASIEVLADRYDLIVLDHPHVGLIADSGCLLPLEMPEDAALSSLGGSLESYVWNGKLWAYPVDAACQMAVERPDLPARRFTTWDAVLDERADLKGVVTPLLPVDAFDMMMTLLLTRGETDLPFSKSTFVSNENGLLALRILKILFQSGPSEAAAWNPIKVLEAMATTDDFAYSPCLFGYINYARPGFRENVLSYTDLPRFQHGGPMRGILGGAGIGASARSKTPELAAEFARWVSSEPVQSGIYLENQGQPAHRATWDRMGDHPHYRGFLTGARATMDHAWTRPRDVWFLGFVDDVCAIFPDFFAKNRDETTFLSELNALYVKHRRGQGT